MKDYLMRIVVYGFLAFPVWAEDTAKVVGQSEPVVATVDDDVILPCTLRTIVRTINAVEEAVVWQRPDLKPKEVHFYRSRDDYNDDQNNNYRGRTSLFKEELKNGNISLKLTGVKLSDDGIYICFIPTLKSLNQKASVQLSVGAASKPQITVFGVDPMGVILKCEAGGLMYGPEMTWLNSDGNILPDGPTETETDSDGRYTVRGHVTIQKTDNNKFTCRVQQHQINHKMETEIHVPDQMFSEPWSYWSQSYWWAWLIGGLTGGACGIYWGLPLYGYIRYKINEWIRKKRNRDTTDDEDSPMSGVEDGNKEAVQTGS
ncbi:butyrophilin subfamily 1 member A1-like [Esox lucius]|uniref:Ig-like domain-containing protein n=1 Tax=Esox lucius TaxID=8010 RepID=A0AAY5KZE3_ESOLU|nr:butyrophilin subfamily 1 member A1-like [Esox lucius]